MTTGFVAMGFSKDGTMIGSDAIIGWVDGKKRDVLQTADVEAYTLPNKVAAQLNPSIPLTNIAAQTVNGMTTVQFTRNLADGNVPLNPTGPNYIIASFSSYNNKFPSYHGPNAHASVLVNSLTTGSATAITMPPWRTIHGSLMFASWGVMLTFGMLFARYARHLKDAIWFKVHRATQYTGYGVACVGFVFAFVAGQGNHFYYLFHSVWGCFIMIFGLCQVVGAFFRPHKEAGEVPTKERKRFEYFHWWTGRLAVTMVVLQVVTGLEIIYGVSSLNTVILAYLAVAAAVIAVIFILELTLCSCPPAGWKVIPCCFCYTDGPTAQQADNYYKL